MSLGCVQDFRGCFQDLAGPLLRQTPPPPDPPSAGPPKFCSFFSLCDVDRILTRTNCNKNEDATNVTAQTFERRTDSETKIGDNVPSFRQKERTSSLKIRNLGGRNHYCPSSLFGKHCMRQSPNSKTLRESSKRSARSTEPCSTIACHNATITTCRVWPQWTAPKKRRLHVDASRQRVNNHTMFPEMGSQTTFCAHFAKLPRTNS